MSERKLSISLESEAATEAFGIAMAKAFSPGMVIGLVGTLGSGKTRLTQAIARGLDVKEPVVSPTYTICVPYAGRLKLLHMDAYRISQAEEVDELDLFERVEDGEVLIVEWADRIEAQLPDIDVWVRLTPSGDVEREVEVQSCSAAGDALLESLSDLQNN